MPFDLPGLPLPAIMASSAVAGELIPKIIDYEHHARRTLLNDRTTALDDKICRALGILRSARLLTSDTALGCAINSARTR